MKANKHLLLGSSAATLVLLVTAAYEENVTKEWRVLQSRAVGPAGPIDVHLRQVVVPSLKAADRCVTCHVGMAAGEMIAPRCCTTTAESRRAALIAWTTVPPARRATR